MGRKTVDELVKEKLAALNQDTEDARAVKEATMKSNVDTYNQQVDANVAQQTGIYEDSIRDAQRAEKTQLADNYIDELVARKNLENTMADAGLTDSGLNRGQQTALTVMRGNADSRARQTAVDKVQSFRDAINQVMIGGEQQKSAYQQQQSAALSEWYQNQLLANKQNANTAAVEQYNAETEAIEKQQEAIRKQNETMLKNGYVQDKNGNWMKDNTAERTTYAMTLIKNEVPEDEAWASAYYRYPTSDEKINTYYAAYKDGVSRGYTGDALKAYANAGGGEAGKAAANQILYSGYDSELIKSKVDTGDLTKFYSGRFGDFITTEIEDIAGLRNANQDVWNKSALKMSEKAQKALSKTDLSDTAKQYAEAKALGEQYSRVWDNYRNVNDSEKQALSVKIYNALGSVLSGDMLQVAAQAAGLTVED